MRRSDEYLWHFGKEWLRMTRQQYIRQVAKHLKCTSAKKKEIEKQLDSHIEIALEEGRRLEEILAEMGEPEAIAGDFNENFDEKERGRFKGKKMLFVLVTLAVLVLAVGGSVVWWMLPKQWEITHSGMFTEEEVLARTEEVLEVFNSGDFDALIGYCAPEVREVMISSDLDEAKRLVSADWGEFRSLGHAYMAEVSQKGVHTAIVQLNVAYDNVGVTFTLMYDEKMDLVGIYMK